MSVAELSKTQTEPILDPPDLNLRHLQAELARLDVLIQREVRRWQLAGQDPHDDYRGLYLSDADARVLAERPLGISWGQTVSLPAAEAEFFAAAETQARQAVQRVTRAARQQGQTLRLVHLAAAFGLDDFELDALLICLASSFDLRYEQLYGYLQDNLNRRRPGVNLVLNLLGPAGPERLRRLSYFAGDAPLRRYELLQLIPEIGPEEPPLLRQSLAPDPTLAGWLLGEYRPRPELGPEARLHRPETGLTDLLLAAHSGPALQRAAAKGAVLVFYGPDRLRQAMAVRLLARQLGRPLLEVDLAALSAEGGPILKGLKLALRDARLVEGVAGLFGWDACLAENGAPPAALLAELDGYPGLLVVAGERRWQPGGLKRQRPFHWLEFPVPGFEQRQALLDHFLASKPGENDTPQPVGHAALDLPALAGQFVLTSGQIRDLVDSARDAASQADRALVNEDLFAAARAHSNPRLADLARKIEPRYNWADIILPADQLALLREIVATVRGRPQVLEAWGVGRKLASSAGVTVLFAGPPGTGKTMAAEVMAGELKLDLYKIDLASVVSKYIGETEKNLEKIFNEAQSSNAILFFDEADAIFGKRSEVKDAHDRYANIEISYLLQRMESYDGVTILATNLRANLDEAFTRRLQFAVDFPFPEKEDRLRIWLTLFPPGVPRQPELNFDLLARRFELAGGNIRNIIVSAAYLAAADGQRVTMEHLLHGTRRELQKMGRLVGEEEFT